MERITQRLVYGIVAEFAVFVIVSSGCAARLVASRSQEAALDGQIHKLAPKVGQITRLQNSTLALAPKISALSDAQSQTNSWRNSIIDITYSLPQDMWITSITSSGTFAQAGASSDTDTAAHFTISGSAGSEFSVGQAMLMMNAKPSIAAVTLGDVSHSVAAHGGGVSCQLVAKLKLSSVASVGGDHE
jgi:Tfp pilus assembly protein PilN